jgi:ectoine hydroxylase-related dioxygenase (phytanoyl-CoA dioxygenase family)
MESSPPRQSDATAPTAMDDYLFDLRGFVVVEDALSEAEVTAMNEAVDDILPIEPGDWHGGVQRRPEAGSKVIGDSVQLQQIYELPPFETLIDHPSWIEHVKRFVGNQDDFDTCHGPLYIDENFYQLTPEGEGTDIHSGGHTRTKRTQFRYHDDAFHCGQVNVLVAFDDIGPGDGATMAVPGSHKQNFAPPFLGDGANGTLEDVPGAEEIHLEAGDALLFVDSVMHGSATRVTPGKRRFAVFRYGPSWGVSRRGYEPTDDLLDRVTAEQAELIETWGSVERKVPPAERDE